MIGKFISGYHCLTLMITITSLTWAIALSSFFFGECDGCMKKVADTFYGETSGDSSLIMKRVKRDYEYDVDVEPELTEVETCDYLPIELSKPENNSMTFLQLLRHGYTEIARERTIKEAILLMGNSASKKNIVARVLADALTGMEVRSDDDNQTRIVISDPTVLNEHTPHLYAKGKDTPNKTADCETKLFFYDCPELGNPNHSLEEKLAIKFFMKQLLGKVSNIKILLVVSHHEMNIGNGDNKAFDLLLNQVVNLFDHIESYGNSIGIVVLDGDGERDMTTDVLLKDAQGFLQAYKKASDQRGDSESEKKKKNLINNLLHEDDPNGPFTYLSSFIQPRLCIKDLTPSVELNTTGESLTNFYSKVLQFSHVNMISDFILDNDDNAKLFLHNQMVHTNHEIADAVHQLLSNFTEFIITQDRSRNNETLEPLASRERFYERVIKNLNNLEMETEKLENPVELLKLFRSYLKTDGFNLTREFRNVVGFHQKLLEFDDLINPGGTLRMAGYWATPIDWAKKNLGMQKDRTEDIHKLFQERNELQIGIDTLEFEAEERKQKRLLELELGREWQMEHDSLIKMRFEEVMGLQQDIKDRENLCKYYEQYKKEIDKEDKTQYIFT